MKTFFFRRMTSFVLVAGCLLMLIGCAGCSEPKEGSITGKVVEITSLTLRVEDGQKINYLFDIDSALGDILRSLHAGDTVSVHFRGTLEPDYLYQTVTVTGLEILTRLSHLPSAGTAATGSPSDTAFAVSTSTGNTEPGTAHTNSSTTSTTSAATTASTTKPPTTTTAITTTTAAPPPAADGLFSAYWNRAEQAMRRMSTAEKVGQIFLVRCPASNAVGLIRSYKPGGLVLFARDFDGKSAARVKADLASYQQASSLPLLLATDEEGGKVIRVSRNPQLASSPFPSPQALFAAGGLKEVRRDGAQKAALLLSLGINVNLAPVADVSVSPEDYIYSRTLGRPAMETAAYVAAAVESLQQGGLSATLKHFPGYGNNVDTHTGIAVDNRPLSVFEENDLLPFRRGIEAGVHAVLVSHNIVTCLDADLPASLSPAVHRLLRDKLGFSGVMMTDDLAMGAIQKGYTSPSPAVRALLAGNDLLIVSDITESSRQVAAAVENGTLPMELLNTAVTRVLAMKYAKGLL